MKAFLFLNFITGAVSNGNKAWIKCGEVGYWSVESGDNIRLDWSLCFKKVFPGKGSYRNSLVGYGSNHDFYVFGEGGCKLAEKFPDELSLHKLSEPWHYEDGVWRNQHNKYGREAEVALYDPVAKVSCDLTASKFHHASPDGYVVTEGQNLVKRNFMGEVVWCEKLDIRHNVLDIWHDKRLMIVPDGAIPDCRIIHMDTGEQLYSLPLMPGVKRLVYESGSDIAYFVTKGILYVIIFQRNEFKVLAEVRIKALVDASFVYLLKNYIVIRNDELLLSVISRSDFNLVKSIDVNKMADRISGVSFDLHRAFISLKDEWFDVYRLTWIDFETFINTDRIELEDEFLSCQVFSIEEDSVVGGFRVRVKVEPDLDFNTLCRHLPIGLYRAVYEYATCLGPGYVEGKYELPNFNGLVYADLSDYNFSPKEIELLRAYIDIVHKKVEVWGYGTPDKKKYAQIVTNYPGLFNK